MFKLKTYPYNWLFIAAMIFLLASFLKLKGTFDVHLYDTFYVVSKAYASWGIVLILLLLWLIYVVTNRWVFSKTLLWLHLRLSLAACVFLGLRIFFLREFESVPAIEDNDGYATPIDKNLVTLIVATVLLSVALVLQLVNIGLGITKKRSKS